MTNAEQAARMIVSSDGHIGPPAERYREYFDPKYVADFDQWLERVHPGVDDEGDQGTRVGQEPADAA